MVIAALFSFILAAVDDHEIGSASGVLTAVQAVGGAVGVAIFGSVFFDQVKTADFTTGFHHALIVQAGLLMAFLAITFFLPKRETAPHRRSPAPGEPPRDQRLGGRLRKSFGVDVKSGGGGLEEGFGCGGAGVEDGAAGAVGADQARVA